MGPPLLNLDKGLKINAPRRLKNAIFRVAFATTVFHKRPILLIHIKCATHSLAYRVYYGPIMVGP